ncbi:acyl-CoA thioesterase II [Nocardioides sp. Y6]|uniref:Acyl-CoA thioesterase II n=1 Tax=Nocardioides malaquae TaxID=2773426 RepID=A0ABR9RNF6_9ACTN|nr:acyl-CoA thioesterase II [Nocardioides malaquae]MBE7323099.1 acyl-CoA thioesterase II [Nocardioides malaquae]
MAGSVEKLLELLEIEQLDVDLFRGAQPETERQRVFGGQVAAQALVAASRSADPEFELHSLHSYFLRPGDHLVPIIYRVERIRDGRSFETRRVVALQHGREIYSQTCNFQKPEDGYEHSDQAPVVGRPEEGLSLADLAAARSEKELRHWQHEWAGLDIRHMGMSGHGLEVDPARPAEARLWVKVDGALPDDPVLQKAAFTYASDLTLIGASLVPHGIHINSPKLQPASLDHTIWFHRPLRADDWWLYDQTSPSASGGRGLSLARVFASDGTLAATVAQEGLIRRIG